MAEFEQLFINALVNAVMEPRSDQWGNPVLSSFRMTFDDWWRKHQEEVMALVVQKLDRDDISEKVAERVTASLMETETRWSPKNYAAEKLGDRIRDKVAQRIADKIALPGEEATA